MADDISKKITIDVEINTDGQQQINQYKAAFDSLKTSINNLSNPFSGFSANITELDKDVTKLTASVNKLVAQNNVLASSSEKSKGKITELLSSFGDWKGIIESISEDFGEWGIAAAAVIAILVTFKDTIKGWVKEIFNGTTTLTALGKALKDNKIVQDAVNRAKQQGVQNAQQELVQLKLVYKAMQDQKVSGIERQKLLTALQNQYPGYFDNLSVDAFLTGKASEAYKKLSNSIIAVAQARAAQDMMVDNSKRQLQDQQKITELQTKLVKKQKELDAAQKAHDAQVENLRRVITPAGVSLSDGSGAEEVNDLTKKRDELRKAISHLDTDSKLLVRQNDELAKTIIGDTEKNGAKVLGVQSAYNDRLLKGTKDTQSKQVSLLTEAEQIRKESLIRQMQTTYEAYGSEAATESNHYQGELNKLKSFFKNKQITKKEFDDVSKQLNGEHQANMAAIINKYNEQDKEKTEQAQNELTELAIKGMQEGSAKQIAELNFEQTEKLQQLKKSNDELDDQQKKLAVELAETLALNPSADVSALKNRLDAVNKLLEINGQKKITIEQQTKDALKKIADQEAHDKLVKADQKSIDKVSDPEAKLAVEKKLITDKYQFEIEQAQGNNKKIEDLENERNEKIKELDEKAATEKAAKAKKAAEELSDFEEKLEKKAAEAAFSIISNSIKQASEAKIAGLEQDKTAELSNSSLTSAQKIAIEQKYKRQEAQIKIKAFKEEQEASIAQALINGALAVTKVASQSGMLSPLVIPGIIAETAIQVATIAAQKPPAYAMGGLHYSSDGRGGVLPGYSKTDNTNAYLRSGEGIVVSEAMQVPWARNLVSAINVGFGGRDFSITGPSRGYAVGGIFTDGGDANRYYNQPVHDQKNLANSIAYQMINNFPPVYVDVKDINNQQNILAQTINRVNL